MNLRKEVVGAPLGGRGLPFALLTSVGGNCDARRGSVRQAYTRMEDGDVAGRAWR